jgi:hypothetical protein
MSAAVSRHFSIDRHTSVFSSKCQNEYVDTPILNGFRATTGSAAPTRPNTPGSAAAIGNEENRRRRVVMA